MLSGCGRRHFMRITLRSEVVEASPTTAETGRDALVFFTTECDQLQTPTINYEYTELRLHSKAFPVASTFVHSPSSIPRLTLPVSKDVNNLGPTAAKGPIMVDHIDCGH